MKCIKSGSTIKRVDDKTARAKVASGVWSYTSKEEWKTATRTAPVKAEKVVEAVEGESKVHGLKAKDRNKKNKK